MSPLNKLLGCQYIIFLFSNTLKKNQLFAIMKINTQPIRFALIIKCKYSFHFAILICFILEKKPYSFVDWLPQLATLDAVDGLPFSIFRMDDKANNFFSRSDENPLDGHFKSSSYYNISQRNIAASAMVTPNSNINFFNWPSFDKWAIKTPGGSFLSRLC